MPTADYGMLRVEASGHRGELYLTATRFSDTTWRENADWRLCRNKRGCLYPLTRRLSATIPRDAAVLVLEMNNSRDRIEGLGLVVNRPADMRLLVYDESIYNRVIYKSAHRRDRSQVLSCPGGQALVERLELLCFSGHDHIKRATGATLLPQRWLTRETAKQLARALSSVA